MSNKKTCLLKFPCNTISGYGKRSADFALSLINNVLDEKEWEIIIIPTRWGETPQNALSIDNPEHKILLDHFIKTNLTKQPELFIQCATPMEFERLGKFNIGLTASIETSVASAVWLEGVNRMDLTIVSSKHGRDVFLNSSWNKMNNQTRMIEGVLKCEKPVEILFEGIQDDIYKRTNECSELVEQEMSKIKSKFNYLFVSHWTGGDFGHDRKDVATLIKCFLETFVGIGNAPSLILKTSGGTFSMIDREQILNKINNIRDIVRQQLNVADNKLPNVYLLHGSLTDEEMNQLYNHPKVKAMVSFCKGEGYSRTFAEFSVTGKPIIVSGWSGHLDFLNPNHTILLPGQLQKIHPSAVWENVLIPESSWFYVDQNVAKNTLRDVWKNYNEHLSRSFGQANHIKQFTHSKMTERLKDILDKYLPKFSMPIEIVLPDLLTLPKFEK
jgi:hypothetical protein